MKVKILTPAMEYRQEAHFYTQTFGIAGNGEQSFSGGAEQEVVNNLFVVEGRELPARVRDSMRR